MQCEPSISRIKRSTNGGMALTSLAIHASTSSRLPDADVLAKFARKSERPFSTSIRAIMNPRLQPRANHSPLPHGIQASKSLAISQHAVPLLPLTDETKSREHAIFSSRVAHHAILKATVSTTGGGPDVAFADPT